MVFDTVSWEQLNYFGIIERRKQQYCQFQDCWLKSNQTGNVNDRPEFALLALLTPPVFKMQLAFAPQASEKHFEKAEHSFVYLRRGQL